MATKTHIVRTEEDQVEKAVQIRSDDPGSPVSNQTWINTTDKKMKFYDGADVQNVGAAGVGSASTFALFQAEDGDISSFTNMAVESGSPIAGDKSYSVSSLPAATPAVSVDERRAGAFCIVSLISKMTSGSGRIVVKDNSSNELVSQVVSSTSAEKVSMSFSIPSGATSVQVHFEDDSTPVGWIVDDIEFSDDVGRARVNLEDTDTVVCRNFVGYGSTNTRITRFDEIAFADNDYTHSAIAASQNSPNGLFTITSSAASGTEITINRDGQYTISLNLVFTGGGYFGITRNATTLTQDIFSVPNDEKLAQDFTQTSAQQETTTWSGQLKAGDIIRGHTVGSTPGGNNQAAFLNISGRAISKNLITSAQGIENHYSAYLLGNATIQSQSSEFIQSITETSTGEFDVVFVPGFFLETPSIVVSSKTGQSRDARIKGTPSASGFSYSTFIDSSFPKTPESADVFISVQRQGSDYRNPNAYSVTPIDKFESKPFVTGTTTFNNLTVGKIYHLTGTLLYNSLAAGAPSLVTVTVSGAIGTTRTMKEQTSVSGTLEVADHTLSPNYKFKATSTSLSIALTTLSGLSAAGSNTVELTECNSCEEVSGVF